MRKKYIISIVVIVLIFLISISSNSKENFAMKKDENKIGSKKEPKLGLSKMVQVLHLHPILPNLATPLRDHVQIRIVKVPLTPFEAPLFMLPESMIPLTDFLLWNPDYLTPVRDQGDCGSCWAFAFTDTIADRLSIQTGGIFRKNISVQQILECFNRNGCNGGSPEKIAFQLSESNEELSTENKIKYRQRDGGDVKGKCILKSPQGVKVSILPDSVVSIVEFIPEINYDKSILLKNIENMKRVLHSSGPFYCAMAVYDDLFGFAGVSVYSRSKGSSLVGGHAIQIIGYCDKGVDKRMGFKDKGYWICRNSWGSGWPTNTEMSGYFAIEMGVNMCGVESRCGYANGKLIGEYDPTKKEVSLSQMRFTNYNQYMN